MDRSFRDRADFKMNQQNFKLSDFGVAARALQEPKKRFAEADRGSFVGGVSRNVGYYSQNDYKVQCQGGRVNPACQTETSGSSSGPSTSSPVYWKQYGGQESGVNNRFRTSFAGLRELLYS